MEEDELLLSSKLHEVTRQSCRSCTEKKTSLKTGQKGPDQLLPTGRDLRLGGAADKNPGGDEKRAAETSKILSFPPA